MTPWPVEIAVDGNVSAGAALARIQGRLALTVIVKATFQLCPDTGVVPTSPAPIAREDTTYNHLPTRSVEVATDLAPYLGRCDVTFVGHGYAPRGGASASLARLALYRENRALLDKTIHVFGDRTSGAAPMPFSRMPITYERAFGGPGNEANPVGVDTPNLVSPNDPRKPACFGPISRFWPARKGLLGGAFRKAWDGAIPEIPENMPWAYYQAAPVDQQIEYLRGSEWLVLDGLHPTLPRLATRLLETHAEARIYNLREPQTSFGIVPLLADTLAIDGDHQRCSIVYRGLYEIPRALASLPEIFVGAGLALPGRPIVWSRIESMRPTAQKPENTAPARLDGGTHSPVVGDSTIAASSAPDPSIPITPFARTNIPPANLAPFAPPGASPNTSATPWSAAPIIRAPQAMPGYETLGLGSSPRTMEVAEPALLVAPPAMVASSPALEPIVKPIEPPTPVITAAPASSPAPARLESPADAAPVRRKQVSINSVAKAAKAIQPNVTLTPDDLIPSRKTSKNSPEVRRFDADSLASTLWSAGADESDVAALRQALRPRTPPPPDDE